MKDPYGLGLGLAIGGGSFILPYTATPVNFDGTNDFLTRGADLTGLVNSQRVTWSFWFRYAALGASQMNIFNNALSRFFIRRQSTDNTLRLGANNEAGTLILRLDMPAVADTGWHHWMGSVDLSSVSLRHSFFDGVSTGTWTIYNTTGGDMDLTDTDWLVGAVNSTPSALWAGDMADVFVKFGTYTDLSQAGNRDLFLNGNKPANPSNWPANPHVALRGDVANWHTNKGTGGGFTENGALADGTGPVEF